MVTTRSGAATGRVSPSRPRVVLVRQRRPLPPKRADELLQMLPILVFFLSLAALVVLEANGLLLQELQRLPPAPKQQFWVEVLRWL